jgi:hypothetical protein
MGWLAHIVTAMNNICNGRHTAQTRDYVRQSLERLIGGPILRWLRARYGEPGGEARLLALLEKWRGQPEAEQGYGPGNVVNLLRPLRNDLRGLDLAYLTIRHAYLADVSAKDASLVGAHLTESVLAEAFDFRRRSRSVRMARCAAGTSTGDVRLRSVAIGCLDEWSPAICIPDLAADSARSRSRAHPH